jgi:hypothetical protein
MTKRERIAELVRQLEAARPAASADEALHLVTSTLEAIEDQHSGVPNDPSSPFADERIWPPIARYHFAIEGRDDLDGYRQKGHETLIGANGAILIRTRIEIRIILDKPGRDGRKVSS